MECVKQQAVVLGVGAVGAGLALLIWQGRTQKAKDAQISALQAELAALKSHQPTSQIAVQEAEELQREQQIQRQREEAPQEEEQRRLAREEAKKKEQEAMVAEASVRTDMTSAHYGDWV